MRARKRVHTDTSTVSKDEPKEVEESKQPGSMSELHKKIDNLIVMVTALTEEVIALKKEWRLENKDPLNINSHGNINDIIYPEKPFETPEAFIQFNNELKLEEKFDLLVNCFLQKCTYTVKAKSFIFNCWKTLITDEAAQHFAWINTTNKTLVQNLLATAAIKKAFQKKYGEDNVNVFEEKSKKFFLNSKDRCVKRRKKQ
ncbi:uncharacterized protein LOC119684968 [Teleopsis dalmanni]|uniref:uncharacterized protein LOC119684140 n=1 Tax=Teleopsis dalmanni TaxID=139649 RepID=UPI0018CC8979|nr:uncharacterized protein LOC119684140 [Teleopsis dalmanni]XP_037955055.1 uncharacterized protein LOC119684968 [Teleopsis dalmanni]